ncbi:MAG: putative glycoside hydrolase [Methylovirgula sp.]
MKHHFGRLACAAGLLLFCAQKAHALDGFVRDSVSSAAIADATVVLGNQRTTTNASGHFVIDAKAEKIFARAPGYRAGTFDSGKVPKSDAILRLSPFLPKALYLTVYGIGSKKLREGALALVDAGAVNALVIDIKGDRGLIPYPSALPLANADGARQMTTIPDLAGLIKSLHEKGIYAIARIVTFKDQPLATARPDLAIKLANGALYRDRERLAWTDPFQPAVRAYNIGVAIEAARAGFDEVQFDYVRFPDSPSRLRFAGPANQRGRLDAIAGFLAEARRDLTPYNVYLAVDIFGYVCWNLDDTGIGQRLEEIAPNVDYLSPMLYPSGFQFGIPGYRNPVAHSYEIVRQSLDQAQERLKISPRRFRPWLQAFRDYAFDRRLFDAAEVAAQIRAAKDFGSDGWMLWNPHNVYGGTGLAASTLKGKIAALARPGPCN